MMPAQVALKVSSGALSPLLKLLLDQLSSPIMQHFRVHDKLSRLEKSLCKIHSLVAQEEARIVIDPSLAVWIRELKVVAYDAQDILEEFATQGKILAQKYGQSWLGQLMQLLPQIFSEIEAGSKFDETLQKLEDMAKERKDLMLFTSPSETRHHLWPAAAMHRETSSLLIDDHDKCIFGREADVEKMVDLLLRSRVAGDGNLARVLVLPIVAMGGLGKTTLAQLVYNDPRVMNHFEQRLWVCESTDFNVRRMAREILESISNEKISKFLNWDKLLTLVKWKLSQKRFLLIVDDVWCENQLEWEAMYAPLSFGKEGSRIVVTTRSERVASVVGTMRPFFLEPLSDGDCWRLLKFSVFGSEICDVHATIEEIGYKIARRLKGVPLAAKTVGALLSLSSHDETSWSDVLGSEIWKLPQNQFDITPVLKLSYQYLPAHLKLCFAFCSVFPKSFEFDKLTLVQLWMAQGFILPQGQRRLEDIGFQYLDDLASRYFFQKAHSELGGCKLLMHDLMHDLAGSISVGECLLVRDNINVESIPQKVIHYWLHSTNSLLFQGLLKCSSLRTLLSMKNAAGHFDLPNLFKSFTFMRALDLSCSGIIDLPVSIKLLKHLRYLDLSSNNIRFLPDEVGDLFNLQTMKLVTCPIRCLPETMNKLINLRSLEGKAQMLWIIGKIRNLTCLQELVEFRVSKEDGHRLEELKDMTELGGKLHLSELQNVLTEDDARKAMLNCKRYLHTLELEWDAVARDGGPDQEVLESLKPHSELKDLKITGNGCVQFPTWLTAECLPNLKKITLKQCQRCADLPALGQWPMLEELEMLSMRGVQRLHPEFWADCGFPSLKTLKIRRLSNWDESPGVSVRQLLPSLIELEISNCTRLQSTPFLLPRTLRRLKLINVGLEALPLFWGYNDDDFSTQQCALEALDVMQCQNLVSLATQDARAFCSLKTLKIDGCPRLTFSQTRNDEYYQPPLCHVYNFTSLTFLSISNSDNLQSLHGEGLRRLTALQTLIIMGCSILTTIGIQFLGSLKSVVVKNCERIVSLCDRNNTLNGFIPIRSIRIESCAQLENLPGGMHDLSSLEELSMSQCLQMSSLPPMLPSSLKRLEIKGSTELAERYKRGGAGWEVVSFIPNLYISS